MIPCLFLNYYLVNSDYWHTFSRLPLLSFIFISWSTSVSVLSSSRIFFSFPFFVLYVIHFYVFLAILLFDLHRWLWSLHLLIYFLGYVEVKKVGWTSFSYFCFVDNKIVQESTGHLEQNLKEIFKVSLDGKYVRARILYTFFSLIWFMLFNSSLMLM